MFHGSRCLSWPAFFVSVITIVLTFVRLDEFGAVILALLSLIAKFYKVSEIGERRKKANGGMDLICFS